MADVELLIKIPEEVRVAITRMGLLRISDEMQKKVDKAIQRGTPLPKGHGRLIDADALLKEHRLFDTYPFPSTTIDNAPTIIEADKEGE